MSKIAATTWNLADVHQKHKLMGQIAKLPPGLYDIGIKRRARTRTLDQNAYWWVALVTPFLDYLREVEGDPSITKEQAHLVLKREVMGAREIVSKKTGEVIELIPDSRTLDVDEFTVLVDNAAKWLSEWADIIVIPAEAFFESQGESKRLRKAS